MCKISGITLVALVVTLIVLLILAGITIATLFGENGIIKIAQKAKEDTEKSSKNELDALNMLEGEMENAIKGNTTKTNEWTQSDPLKPEITNGEITLKIGDYVDYDCTTSNATYTSPKEKTGHTEDQVFKANEYQYGWRVLGVDEETKELLLISEELVPLTGGGSKGNRTNQYYYLREHVGYVNGTEELNKICEIYGKGRGAVGARCVTNDDIDKITGYNPNNIGRKDPRKLVNNGVKFNEGNIDEYGNSVKYTLTSEGVKYEAENGSKNGTSSTHRKFVYCDAVEKDRKELAINESITLKCNFYKYYPTTLSETEDVNATIGIASTSSEYKMLFTNSSTGADKENIGKTDNFCYWISLPFISTYAGGASYGLQYINNGFVDTYGMFGSSGVINGNGFGVRPIVTLSSKIKLKDSGTMKDGCKLYNMTVNN